MSNGTEDISFKDHPAGRRYPHRPRSSK
jgi:hypothetical protein